jgi:hypothetical protein
MPVSVGGYNAAHIKPAALVPSVQMIHICTDE